MLDNISYRGSVDWMEQSLILTPIAGVLNLGEGLINCYKAYDAYKKEWLIPLKAKKLAQIEASVYQAARGICGMIPVIGWLFLKCLGLLANTSHPVIQELSSEELSLFKDLSTKSISYGTELNYPFALPNFQGIPNYDANNPLCGELSEIQDRLQAKYEYSRGDTDFNHADWHGYFSFQRMVWQDPEVLKFLKKPGAATLILSAHKSDALKPLGQSRATIAGLLFGGFSGMLPLYLFTVRPNFHRMPPGITPCHLDSYGLVSPSEDLIPPVDLALAKEAFLQFDKELRQYYHIQQSCDLMLSIENAPVEALINTIHTISKPQGNLPKIVLGLAPTTNVYQMQEQCEVAMKLLTKEYVKRAGGYANVLRYALVSHALDGRHLSAALAGMDQLPNFKAFFHACLEDERARELIKIRLQQVVYQILTLKDKLNTLDSDLSALLNPEL